jgi:hypothetical protein
MVYGSRNGKSSGRAAHRFLRLFFGSHRNETKKGVTHSLDEYARSLLRHVGILCERRFAI